MGTRGLTCVVQDKQFKVAQYGQWDHYPEGQGQTVLAFLRSLKKKEFKKFEEAVRKLGLWTDEAIEQAWVAAGAPPGAEFVSQSVSLSVKEAHPELSRDTAAEILKLIYEGRIAKTRLEVEFVSDSLFCEWAYVVDLDKRVFEVYRGFVQKPHKSGRFWRMVKFEDHRQEQYYPIRRVRRYKLDNLPTIAEFLGSFVRGRKKVKKPVTA